MMNVDEVLQLLDALEDTEFGDAAGQARIAISTRAVVVTRSASPVPVASLENTYRTRRDSPRLRPERAAEFDELLRVLKNSPGESWHIYAIGKDPLLFALFASETGSSRACLDVSPR